MTLWNIPDVLDSFSWKGRGNALEGSFLAIPQEISRARRCWKQGEGGGFCYGTVPALPTPRTALLRTV